MCRMECPLECRGVFVQVEVTNTIANVQVRSGRGANGLLPTLEPPSSSRERRAHSIRSSDEQGDGRLLVANDDSTLQA